jgi:hypothetical protein
MPQGDSLNEDSSADKPHAWTRAPRARARGFAQERVIPSARAGMGVLVPPGTRLELGNSGAETQDEVIIRFRRDVVEHQCWIARLDMFQQTGSSRLSNGRLTNAV